MAAKRPFLEFLLQVVNLIFTLYGVATLFYGLYCLVKWADDVHQQQHHLNKVQTLMAHPRLLSSHSSEHLFDLLPSAWFIYLLIAIGATLFIVSCFGYIGAASRSTCCLTCYSSSLIVLVMAEIGVAVFMFLHDNWKQVVPRDRSGNMDTIYNFLNRKWKIIKWVAIGTFVLEVIALLLAFFLRAVISHDEYGDSDDDSIVVHRPTILPSLKTKANSTPPIAPRKSNLHAVK